MMLEVFMRNCSINVELGSVLANAYSYGLRNDVLASYIGGVMSILAAEAGMAGFWSKG
jgi:uncharacterized membrane protein